MTAPYNANSLAVISHMITASKDQITAQGTLTERSAALPGHGMCIIDPSTQAVPVKIFRGTPVRPGDRVCLIKFGSDWVVVDGFGTSFIPAPITGVFDFNPIFTTTSASYVDMGDSPTITLTKRYDWTDIDVDWRSTSYAVGTSSAVMFGLLVNGVDYDVLRFTHTQSTVRMPQTARVQINDLPAGQWSFVGRWFRASGTATLTMNLDDYLYLTVTEVDPAEG